MENKGHLPIKVILQRTQDVIKNIPNGDYTYFCDVTPELRANIASSFQKIADDFEGQFQKFPNVPCVAKVKVKKKAIAKSHKPNRLCIEKNCPIIGNGVLDEILIMVTPHGIENVIKEVFESKAKALEANLTTIESIDIYDKNDKCTEVELEKIIEGIDVKSESIKVKLFNFRNQVENDKSYNSFIKLVKNQGLENDIIEVMYTDKLKVFKIDNVTKDNVEEIISFNSVKTVSTFPNYTTLDTEYSEKDLHVKLDEFNDVEPSEEHPIIGIVDSGIAKNHPYLEKWVYERVVYVHDAYQNNSHGTFVAGVIQYGDFLNDFKAENDTMFRFLDVVALPNSDSDHGEVDYISEDYLTEILHDVLSKYGDKVKIWNISLGTESICCNERLSDLAMIFDYLQDYYKVRFVVSAGNLEMGDMRTWPVKSGLSDYDRVTAPADSVRAITVGSIAHKKSSNSLVRVNEPSPFSRRGPGANFIIKPDVVDYGGNCDINGCFEDLGILSLDPNGNITEDIGTSFSAPRIAKKMATIGNNIVTENDDNLLISKALLIHSTKFTELGRIKKKELYKYYGFGMPLTTVEDILFCNDSSITMIFDQVINKGSHVEVYDFPYPKVLKVNNKWKGQIYMTLVYDPPLDPNFGQEYCRANLTASLGTYYFDNDKNKLIFKGQVPEDVRWEKKYEEEMIKNGFKWAPVKSYFRDMPNGIDGHNWKLRVNSLSRNNEVIESQRFVLVVTIIDPSKEEDIYTDVTNQLRNNGFVFNDLRIKQQLKQRYNTEW